MNPMELLKIRGMWEEFVRNHPKFPMFLQAAAQEGIREGTVLECKMITPEGREMTTNIKVRQSDLELFETLSKMRK